MRPTHLPDRGLHSLSSYSPMNLRAPIQDMTGGGRPIGGRGGGAKRGGKEERMDAQAWLPEPFQLRRSGLWWILQTSNVEAARSDVQILEVGREERQEPSFNRSVTLLSKLSGSFFIELTIKTPFSVFTSSAFQTQYLMWFKITTLFILNWTY